MLLINQDVSIPRLIGRHIPNRLIRLLQPPLLHPRLNPLLHTQRQHLLDLMRRPNRTAPDLAPLRNQTECIERRHFILWRTDLDECSICAEQHEVLFQGHVRGGHGADDEVEGAGVVGGPVRVVLRGDEGVGAEFKRVVFLRSGA